MYSPKQFARKYKGSKAQFAALCYRIRKDKPEILLITTRGTGRWIIPKGWPMEGKSPAKAAAREAWEEAGVKGKVKKDSIGHFTYSKMTGPRAITECVALVYPLEVKSIENDFPEQGQRRRKWLSREKAAARVKEPELARLIRDFRPRKLKR